MEAARDGLFYSMLWNSGLRAMDALRLEASQLQLFHGGVYDVRYDHGEQAIRQARGRPQNHCARSAGK